MSTTITSAIKETSVKDLLRALKSNKEYLYFDISVFNVGAVIRLICTDKYKEINPNTWNGYDFIMENDSTMKHYILETLKERLKGCEIDASNHKKVSKAIQENS